jgi:hypothetical protein
MPPSGTFDYVAIVPPEDEREREWPVRLAKPVTIKGNELTDLRLVGHAPVLTITACANTTKPGSKGGRLPQSRFTLKASGRKHASVSGASFYTDHRLPGIFQTGDWLHMTRTACASRGLSLVRDGKLVFALGAITTVHLGADVRAEMPIDLIEESERLFQKRDAEFDIRRFRELPLLIETNGEVRILYRGNLTMGGYEVTVFHGFLPGIPGKNECAAITVNKLCRHSIVCITAQLFDSTEMEFAKDDWHIKRLLAEMRKNRRRTAEGRPE